LFFLCFFNFLSVTNLGINEHASADNAKIMRLVLQRCIEQGSAYDVTSTATWNIERVVWEWLRAHALLDSFLFRDFFSAGLLSICLFFLIYSGPDHCLHVSWYHFNPSDGSLPRYKAVHIGGRGMWIR
jgi:hypothetical protein